MKYTGMPMGMWILFRRSFRNHLVSVLGLAKTEAARATTAAKPKYREIITKLPEFEKADRFKMNIVNCAMLSAFVLSIKERPSVEQLTEYYAKAMMTGPMRFFCRMMGKKKFSEQDVQGMKATAALKAADRNPYSWNMDLVPAMCHLDYTMAETGEACDFVREYTLASGGPYCDCGYRKKTKG